MINGFIAIIIFMLSIVVHEFGHALTAYYYKTNPSITFHYLGGTTIYEPPKHIQKQIYIILNGPLAQSVLIFVPYLILKFLDLSFYPHLNFALNCFLRINQILLIFNMLPLHPLDGGQLVKYLFTLLWKSKGQKIALYISRLSFILLIVILDYKKLLLSPCAIISLVLIGKESLFPKLTRQAASDEPLNTTSHVKKEKFSWIYSKKIYYAMVIIIAICYCLAPYRYQKKEERLIQSFDKHYQAYLDKNSLLLLDMVHIKHEMDLALSQISFFTTPVGKLVLKLQEKAFIIDLKQELLAKEVLLNEKKQALEMVLQDIKKVEGNLWKFKNYEFINTETYLDECKKSPVIKNTSEIMEKFQKLLGVQTLVYHQKIIDQLKIIVNFLSDNYGLYHMEANRIVMRGRNKEAEFSRIFEQLEVLLNQKEMYDKQMQKEVQALYDSIPKTSEQKLVSTKSLKS